MKGWAAAVLLVAGCGLGDGAKDECRAQRDCLSGYTCVTGLCVNDLDDIATVPDPRDAGRNADAGGNEDGAQSMQTCANGTCAIGQACATTADCVPHATCDPVLNNVCAAGTWRAVASMPSARSMLAAAQGSDGRIYAIGGAKGSQSETTVEAYDPSADAWTERAPLLDAQAGLSAVVANDGRIYAIGGQWNSVIDAGNSYLVESYDVVGNTWRSEPLLTSSRYENAAVFANGSIWVTGGDDYSNGAIDSVETFVPGAGSFVPSSDHMTTTRINHAAAVLADGRILVVGGFDKGVEKLASAELYDPKAQSGWSTATPMQIARGALGAATSGALTYVVGGICDDARCSTHVAAQVEAYDPATKKWTFVASMATPRFDLAVIAGSDGRIWAIGGSDATGLSAVVEVYTP